MEIQSIYGGKKTTPAAQTSTDEDKAPASGFAALLDMVGSQFKGALGLGATDPALFKKGEAEAARAAEPREAKQRPERADDKDTKAKPAKDDADESDEQTDGTAAADDKNAGDADTGAQTQTGAQQAVTADVAAAVDVTALAQTAAVTTAVAAETVATVTTETVTTETDAAVTEVVATASETQTVETVAEPKAVQQAEVKTAEKVVAPEAVVKEAVRTQQTTSAYTPAQTTENEAVQVETETAAIETKTAGKDTAVRADVARSTTAQDQASHLARLLGNENRVQVQVNVNAAHTAKQSMPDVSIYNIYSGYSAADAISLANGQFGQTADTNALTQQQTPARTDGASQAAVVAQAAQPVTNTNANTQTNAPARAEGFSPTVVQASASSSGASNANMGFGAFTQGGASSGTAATQQAAQPNPTERPAATAQQVIDQIKVNITKAAKAGLDRVTINLKPVELGRIEIKLEMSEDHKVRVTVTADNKDTLNLLQTDSRTLERTLNDAGLRTDANNLSFNLRSENDAGAADGQRGQGGSKNNGNAHAETANDNAEQDYDYAAAAYARGGVDTFA